MRVGIDVGGTNTDAVLMDGQQLLAATKHPTTADITGGVVGAIKEILKQAAVSPKALKAVMIGTTHFTNALVECRHLLEVAVIRLASPSAEAIPPGLGWPKGISEAVGLVSFLVPGGYEFDGREISTFQDDAIIRAAQEIQRRGLRAVAVSSAFGPVNPAMEKRAEAILRAYLPDTSISLSTEVGRLGLLERENATVLNASLSGLSRRVTTSFASALRELGIDAPYYISQNDGTLMSGETVMRYPVLTIASGPTNSMRGAAYLTGYKNAIVMDVGGTTSDVGVLVDGFARESSMHVHIGGVPTNFRMPDVYALGLGGGSRVKVGADGQCLDIGPESVGFRLTEDAIVFGGETLTASDIAIAAGLTNFGDKSRLNHYNTILTPAFLDSAMALMGQKFEGAIDRMKASAIDVPIILVGGGAVLVPPKLRGVSEIVRPDHCSVANAIGAAIAQVGGEVESIVSYAQTPRQEALLQLSSQAKQRALDAGGSPETVTIIDIEEVSMAYLPGQAMKVRVKAVADLANI